ncbi:winged helix-turn-helix domain-containing protein [Tabrizicola oligotrophica]|uniref:Transcriptional regulator n=1 Tax=Tabrizicola oligotrophica TaxID=2710650 RepID=A0A6M0QVR0_9RHOB|nr:winged helix-turn-helix domain-containing protein [Tabrizicola oligotrophica]NEY91519.1 transcriptional regulator [Tabrizicola oligotrophica]
MIWTFGAYRIDPERHELTRDGRPVGVEPQVFAAILYLMGQRDRMVPRDELANAVWPGGAVSDASIAGRIKAARAALGDDGTRQEVIRTVHGLGFRFVAPVSASPDPGLAPLGRPSVAVLPLRILGSGDGLSILAEAIPHEIILALSRLRWIAVTARGSSFRFRQEAPDFGLVAGTLGVRYVLSGLLEETAGRVQVTVELTDCRNAEVIWADRIARPREGLAELRAVIVARIIAALDLRVPENEARQAELRGSAAFDAWASFHLGLRHLYRFTAPDNALAKGHFERAVALDPGFARAEAGLSFTSFIEAFLRIVPDVPAAARAARRHAERGLELDPLDPFVNFTMGRAHWLTDEAETARFWLARATALNPNYAQGFYAAGFTAMLIGDAPACEAAIDAALELSPIDPLLYGMFGVRAQMLIQQGKFAAAARWAERAATAPGAHHLIALIAVAACGLAGNAAQAARWADTARAKRQDLSAPDFSRAFPIRNAETRQLIEATLRGQGF